MPTLNFRRAAIAIALLPSALVAQSAQSKLPPTPGAIRTDTATAERDAPDRWRLLTGTSVGSLRYQGGRQESAAALLLKFALGDQISFGITPTFAHVSYPAATGSAAASVSGLTDIPVGAGVEHSFGGRFAPTVGISASASIPVGDTAKGLGSGSVGSSFDVSTGFAPAPGMGVSAGVGHSFSDFSLRSALNGTSSGWADVGAWSEVSDRLSVSAGYDRDIGAVDTAYGRSSSVTGGVSYALLHDTNVAISAGHGLTGSSPKWSVSLGFGTAIPSIGGGFHNAISQLAGTFGGGNHGLSKKGGGTSGSGSTAHRRGRGKLG